MLAEAAVAKAADDMKKALLWVDASFANALAALPPEPLATEVHVEVLIKTPYGRRINRRFPRGAMVQSLFDLVDCSRIALPGPYRLIAHFPISVFERNNRETLESVGFTNKPPALFIEMS